MRLTCSHNAICLLASCILLFLVATIQCASVSTAPEQQSAISTTKNGALSVYSILLQSKTKCNYLYTLLLEKEPEFLTHCTNYEEARQANISKTESELNYCMLYFEVYSQLCNNSALSKQNEELAQKLFSPKVVNQPLVVGIVCKQIEAFYQVYNRSKIAEKMAKPEFCQRFCLDYSGNLIEVCMISGLMAEVNGKLIQAPQSTLLADPELQTSGAAKEKTEPEKIAAKSQSQEHRLFGGKEQAAKPGAQPPPIKGVDPKDIKSSVPDPIPNKPAQDEVPEGNPPKLQQGQQTGPSGTGPGSANDQTPKTDSKTPTDSHTGSSSSPTSTTTITKPKTPSAVVDETNEDPIDVDESDHIDEPEAEESDNQEAKNIIQSKETIGKGEKKTSKGANNKPLERNKIEEGTNDMSRMPNEKQPDADSYFFSYFMLFCILFVMGYVGYHNKQKLLALLLEGRRGRRQSRRRPNSANYHKLDCNLEEAVTSSCNKTTSNVIY